MDDMQQVSMETKFYYLKQSNIMKGYFDATS